MSSPLFAANGKEELIIIFVYNPQFHNNTVVRVTSHESSRRIHKEVRIIINEYKWTSLKSETFHQFVCVLRWHPKERGDIRRIIYRSDNRHSVLSLQRLMHEWPGKGSLTGQQQSGLPLELSGDKLADTHWGKELLITHVQDDEDQPRR